MNDLYKVIKSTVVTEKSTGLKGSQNKYSFFVYPNAGKIEIKKAIEELFKVSVVKVNTLNLKGKKRRLGKYEGYRPKRKKAVVTLKEGQTIKIFET